MKSTEKVSIGDIVVWDSTLSGRTLGNLRERHGDGPFKVITDKPTSTSGGIQTAGSDAQHPQILVLKKTTGDKEVLNDGSPISGFLIQPKT